MLPVDTWIAQNPVWIDGPFRIWLAGVLLVMLVLAIRHGRSEAREIMSRHPGWFIGTMLPVVAWMAYGAVVTGGAAL